MTRARGLTGAAGEYYVAAELSRRDWLATVTIKNSPGTDVLAQRLDRQTIIAVQTKTATRPSDFRLSDKDEDPGESDNEWYVLVGLRDESERPDFFLLPRHITAALVYLEYRAWLSNVDLLRPPMRRGKQRNPTTQREVRAEWVEGYRDRWDLLDGSAWDAPFLADHRFLELARGLPLPENYRTLSPPG
jgi:hypothetical protein